MELAEAAILVAQTYGLDGWPLQISRALTQGAVVFSFLLDAQSSGNYAFAVEQVLVLLNAPAWAVKGAKAVINAAMGFEDIITELKSNEPQQHASMREE